MRKIIVGILLGGGLILSITVIRLVFAQPSPCPEFGTNPTFPPGETV